MTCTERLTCGLTEFIQTEKSHCRTLRIMQKIFYQGLLQECDVSREMADRIFPRLFDLLDIHLTFLNRMLERQKQHTDKSITHIADVFREQVCTSKSRSLCIVHVGSTILVTIFEIWNKGMNDGSLINCCQVTCNGGYVLAVQYIQVTCQYSYMEDFRAYNRCDVIVCCSLWVSWATEWSKLMANSAPDTRNLYSCIKTFTSQIEKCNFLPRFTPVYLLCCSILFFFKSDVRITGTALRKIVIYFSEMFSE